MKFKVAAQHPVDLADGRVLGVGEETTKFDEQDPHNASLLDAGLILKIETNKEPESSPEPEVVQDVSDSPPAEKQAAKMPTKKSTTTNEKDEVDA